MSVIASTDVYNQNDDVLFDKRTLERLQKVDIEGLDYEHSSGDDDMNALMKKEEEQKQKAQDEEDGEESVDEDRKRFEDMAAGIEEYYSR